MATRPKLSERIVDDFFRDIGDGSLTEGDEVPGEADIVERYGVSRSVAREGLNALAAKGFLTVRQGAATTVAPKFRWQVLDPDFLRVNVGDGLYDHLVEARETIEPFIVRFAAERRSDADVETFTRLLDDLDATEDPEANAELDVRLHRAFAAAAKNPVLTSMHDSISSLGYRSRALSGSIPGAIARARQWHLVIVQAIIDGDGAAAEAAMLLHLRQVARELESVGASAHNTGPSGR